MPHKLIQYTCCLFIFFCCLHRGDSYWKRKDKEILHHDIDLFKEMAEKIEEEIETLYSEYSEERAKNDNLEQRRNDNNDILSVVAKEKPEPDEKQLKHRDFSTNDISINNVEDSQNIETSTSHNDSIREAEGLDHKSKYPKKKIVDSKSNWPKFDDILLAIGEKYDWKNDRWLKVRRKENDSRKHEVSESKSRINFKNIHKFSYRMVKLNKSRSKKNVVVAVSAVR